MSLKFMRKIIMACATWVGVSFAAPAIWDGTADDSWYEPSAQAYNLTTAEQLAGLAKLVNDGNTFAGKTITLGADIFLNDTTGAGAGTWASIARTPWTPIGTSSRPFKGEFDGIAGKKNRKIYGLYFNDETMNNAGLFGYTDGVKISNLDLLIGRVTAANNIGALVGYAVSGSITNVHSEVKVTGKNKVGGLVGYSTGSLNRVSVQENVTGQDSVGGLVGYTSGSISGTANDSSFFVGDVNGRMYVGGAVGYGSSISKTYAEGAVKGDSNYVGGLAGCTKNGVIESSYHIGGNVMGSSSVGGLVGAMTGSSGSVTGSHSEGNVIGTGNYVGGLVGYGGNYSIGTSYHEKGNVSGKDYVGGLAGGAGSVTGSHSEGDVTGTGDYVGGLVGYASGSVTGSHSEGDVTGTDNYVGGLVGYATSSVTESRSEGDVTGTGDYVGGLVGYGTSIGTSYHEKGKVSGKGNVGGLIGYATGSVIGSHSEGDVTGTGDYIGGLVGYALGSVTGSHSEGNVTGTNNYVGGLIGLSYYCYSSSGAQTIVVVDSSYSIGNVKGVKYVGGLIGLDSIYRSSSYTYRLERQIKRSYAQGIVEGTQYTGGILGKSNFGYWSSSYSSNFYSTIDSVSHTSGIVSGSSYVGGLVGYTYAAVTGSHSEGNVIGTADYIGGLVGSGASIGTSYHKDGIVSGRGYVGGLIGYASSITGSYSEGDVTGAAGYVGGLAGYITSSITDSHSEGNVTGTGNYVGGLTGFGAVLNSYSEGNVIGLDYVGGVVGSSSKIRNSYAMASYIKGRNNVGGLSGYVTDSIVVSYFEGDSVTGIFQVGGLAGYAKSAVDSSYSTANVKGDDNVGGLIGSAYGDVSNSYALGNVDGDVNNSSAGNDNLGGLVGYQYSGSVSKSMALGNITGTTKLGGLVGRFDGTSISQSYANGNVTGSYYGDPADEVGNYYIGGLVGYAKGSLNETYSSGIVKGMDKNPVYTGCMVGYVNGSLSVTKSYYDKSKCNLGIDGGENAVTLTGTPDKTTSEMQTQSTFEDWDFVDTWKILEKSYPFLQIYANSLTNATVETASLEGYKYDGTAKTPLVTSVKLFGETLEYETEYTIEYSNNVNAGTASINVCGVKPYGGCKVVNFEIAGIAVKPTIAAIENETYTGRALTPEIKVYSGETLLAATDYTVEYKDNINAGTATVVVTMKGNYSGSASKTFKIEKATPVISQNPKVGDVILGETLASSELTGGRTNIEGTFVWKNATTKPTLENEGYAVIFVPTDTDNYTNSAEIVVPVKVLDMVYIAIHANGSTIDSATILKGAEYSLPTVAEKIGFDFKGFYKGSAEVGKIGDKITITENTVIDAVYQVKKFVVTFINDTVKIQSSEVAYGEMPEYTGKTPTKTSTAQYAYTFKGWNPELAKVTESATYAAVFDSVVNKYVVTFVNGGKTLQTDSLLYGEVPKYKSDSSPAKPSTEQYDYTFKGWSPTITSVTGTATYTAVFDSTLRKYAITFKNGTITLQTSEVAYGVKPSYTGIAPTKTSTDEYTYTFKGWNPTITSVIGTATYIAVFDSTLREYAVTFKNGTTTLQTGDVAYGTKPSYTGDTPTKVSTDKYSYTFKGWSPTLASVAGAATYTAIFDSTLRKYTITFKNGSTTLQTSDVAYGSKPSYSGDTPTKTSTDKYSYTFKGWSPTLASVAGAATYTAVFDSTLRKYTITFKNGTTTLQTSDVAYGTKLSYTGSTPTKKATDKYTYKFKGWNPAIVAVTKAATYQAVFDSSKVTGIVEGRLASLGLSVRAVSRSIQISAAPKNSTYAILDMQGRVLLKGRVESANFNIAVPNAGSYLVRVGNVTRKVQVK